MNKYVINSKNVMLFITYLYIRYLRREKIDVSLCLWIREFDSNVHHYRSSNMICIFLTLSQAVHVASLINYFVRPI